MVVKNDWVDWDGNPATPIVAGVNKMLATHVNAHATETNGKQDIATLPEAVQDIIGAAIVAGTNVTKTYDDTAGTVTINAAGGGGGGYTPGGTDVALADGGTGTSLTAPIIDKLVGYDVSAGKIDFFTPGAGFTISGTDIFATGGGGGSAPTTEMAHNFAGDTNGAFTTAESGQTVTSTNFRSPLNTAVNMTILAGKLYCPDTATGGTFAHVNVTLSATATYLAAAFNFGASGSTNGQALELAAWITPLTAPEAGLPPDTPCRILAFDDHIEYRILVGGVASTLVSHPYSARGTQNQFVEVVIDKAKSIAVMRCPDGQIITVGHSAIGSLTAPYASFGCFLAAANTDKRVEIQRILAGPTALSDAQRMFDIAYAQLAIPVVVTGSTTVVAAHINRDIEYNSTSPGNITIPPETTLSVAGGSGFGIRQTNTGVATVVDGAGVTSVSSGSKSTDGLGAYVGVTKRVGVANAWWIDGDTA